MNDSSEEGIITNEPPGNEYPKIERNRLDRFPYFLIGQIRSTFNIPLLLKLKSRGLAC